MPTHANAVALVVAALSALTPAHAGVVLPEFSVEVSFNALSINRVGQAAPTLNLFPGIQVQGFTDSKHPDNDARISTINGNHNGQIGHGSSSAGFDDVDGLRDSIGDSDSWRIEITDGGTGLIYTYVFTLDATLLTADHLRRTSIGMVQQGGTISLNPTFHFITDQPEDPSVQYTLAFAALFGPAFYSTPQVGVIDTQWTPDGPILPGTYQFAIQFQGDDSTGTLLVPSTPQPQSFEPSLSSFSFASYYGSYCDVNNLTAAAPPSCPGDLNNDNTVNTPDLAIFLGQFGDTVPPGTGADFIADGVVSTPDLAFLLGRFGLPCP